MANIVQENNYGELVVSDEVIGVIANIAAKEIEGIADMSGGFGTELGEMFGMKSTTKGVKVSVEDNKVKAEIYINVYYGFKLHEVSMLVQKSVTEAIVNMTGLEVVSVDVHVENVKVKEEKEEVVTVDAEEIMEDTSL